MRTAEIQMVTSDSATSCRGARGGPRARGRTNTEDVRSMTQVEKVHEKELTAMDNCHAMLMRSAHRLVKSNDLRASLVR